MSSGIPVRKYFSYPQWVTEEGCHAEGETVDITVVSVPPAAAIYNKLHTVDAIEREPFRRRESLGATGVRLAKSTRQGAYRANAGAVHGILAEVRAPCMPGELGAGGARAIAEGVAGVNLIRAGAAAWQAPVVRMM